MHMFTWYKKKCHVSQIQVNFFKHALNFQDIFGQMQSSSNFDTKSFSWSTVTTPKEHSWQYKKIFQISKRGIFLHGKNPTLAYYICLLIQHTGYIKPTQQCFLTDLGSGPNCHSLLFSSCAQTLAPKGHQYQACGIARDRGHTSLTVTLLMSIKTKRHCLHDEHSRQGEH